MCLLVSCSRTHKPHSIKSLTSGQAKPHIAPPSTQVEKTIWVDARFTDEQRYEILKATEDWTIVSNQMIKYNLEFDYKVVLPDISNKIVIVYLDPDDDMTQALDQRIGGEFANGYLKQNDNEFIFLCPNRIEEWALKIAVEQQLGKEMGLGRLPNTLPGVMNEEPPIDVRCPSLNDMIMFCRLFSCSIEDIKYCEVK